MTLNVNTLPGTPTALTTMIEGAEFLYYRTGKMVEGVLTVTSEGYRKITDNDLGTRGTSNPLGPLGVPFVIGTTYGLVNVTPGSSDLPTLPIIEDSGIRAVWSGANWIISDGGGIIDTTTLSYDHNDLWTEFQTDPSGGAYTTGTLYQRIVDELPDVFAIYFYFQFLILPDVYYVPYDVGDDWEPV